MTTSTRAFSAVLPALLVWAGTFALLFLLDRRVDLATAALLLVLGSVLASLRGSPAQALIGSALAVLAFNFAFVPPRGTWQVALHQHVLLLLAVLGVSWVIALLMARQRGLTAQAQDLARRARRLQELSASMREDESPDALVPLLRQALSDEVDARAEVIVSLDEPTASCSPDERAGMALCRREARAMGPGTGWHDEQPAWYLPLRGPAAAHGVALLRLAGPGLPGSTPPAPADLREHLQSICDLAGAALDRSATRRKARQAEDVAQEQRLRNTLLAAIAHDHRTPLATILGAASSLQDQGDRLDAAQRRRLAATIVDEATQLSRLTDNTLQLARLDAPGVGLRRDWESPEELIGTALRRVRQRHPQARLLTRRIGTLPLVRVDAVLLVQLLDNLIDNALRHGDVAGPVEVLSRVDEAVVRIAVRDRGPGVAPAERVRIFEPFQRGEGRGGAGLGLALCRSVARVHGGELTLRARGHGGTSFELALPIEAQPA
jgi:two-component system sensor histidine kinase KdpD